MQGSEFVTCISFQNNRWKRAWHKLPQSFVLESCAKNILPNKPVNSSCTFCLFCLFWLFILHSSVMSYNIILQLLSLSKVCGNNIHAYSYMTTAFQRCLASRFHVVLAKKNCVHAFQSNNSSFVSVLPWCCLMLISIHRENMVVLH